MKQYLYKVQDKSGAIVKGTIENVNEAGAAKALQAHGYFVITVTEKKSFEFRSLSFSFGSGVSEREVATFTRLLATMLSTGLPLTDALADLALQVKSNHFKEVVRSLLRDVQSGSALSNAMSRYPLVFNTLYVSLIKAGEASGKVDETLSRLADTLENQLDFKSKIKGAMIYPMIVVIAMGAIGFFMLTSVVPKIADVYSQFGAELPLPTRVLIGASDLLTHYLFVVVGLLILLFIIYRGLRKNPMSDMLINNAFFHFPVFGPLSEEVALTIFARTLGTLLSSGVAIIDSLKIVSATMGNNYFREGVVTASKSVEKGLPLSLAIRRNPHFPLMVSQLMSIGEETGTLDDSLDRLAKFYQESSERKVKVLTTALEPLMILLMGGMVGGLAIAVLLPMFNLVNVIK